MILLGGLTFAIGALDGFLFKTGRESISARLRKLPVEVRWGLLAVLVKHLV